MAGTGKPPVKVLLPRPPVQQIQFVGLKSGGIRTVNVSKNCCLDKKGAKK